jgi:hypothetical protein
MQVFFIPFIYYSNLFASLLCFIKKNCFPLPVVSVKVKFCKNFRPIEYPDGQGCYIIEAKDTSPNIFIKESVSFPVSIIDNKMVTFL